MVNKNPIKFGFFYNDKTKNPLNDSKNTKNKNKLNSGKKIKNLEIKL